MLNYSRIILLASILMLDFIGLSHNAVNIQFSGNTAIEALESLLSELSQETLSGLIVIELEPLSVVKVDRQNYNQKRYQWRSISPGFDIDLDPDSLV